MVHLSINLKSEGYGMVLGGFIRGLKNWEIIFVEIFKLKKLKIDVYFWWCIIIYLFQIFFPKIISFLTFLILKNTKYHTQW